MALLLADLVGGLGVDALLDVLLAGLLTGQVMTVPCEDWDAWDACD